MEHGGGILGQLHALLLAVGDFGPGLDYILRLVGHIVEAYGSGVLVVGQCDDGLLAALYGFHLVADIAEQGGGVAVGMFDVDGGLEIVLHAMGEIHLAALLEPSQVRVVEQPLAQIGLHQTSLAVHLHDEVHFLGADADGFCRMGCHCQQPGHCQHGHFFSFHNDCFLGCFNIGSGCFVLQR